MKPYSWFLRFSNINASVVILAVLLCTVRLVREISDEQYVETYRPLGIINCHLLL